MQHYVYRTVTEKLAADLQHIAESGDTVLDRVFVGGRDWVLLCRKGEPTVADLTADEFEDLIVRAVKRANSKTNVAARARAGR